MTSCEPDTSASSNDDGDDDDDDDDDGNDDANLSVHPQTPHPLLKSHLPEAVDLLLLSTGLSVAKFTAQGGEAGKGAQLH